LFEYITELQGQRYIKLPRRTSRLPGVPRRGRSGSTTRPGGHSHRPRAEGAAGAIWSSGSVGKELGCSSPCTSRAPESERLLRCSRSTPSCYRKELEATPTSSRSSRSILHPAMGHSRRSSHTGEDEKDSSPSSEPAASTGPAPAAALVAASSNIQEEAAS